MGQDKSGTIFCDQVRLSGFPRTFPREPDKYFAAWCRVCVGRQVGRESVVGQERVSCDSVVKELRAKRD